MKKAFENSFSMYVLVTNWNSVAWRKTLCENDTMQLWCFLIMSKLGFALTKVALVNVRITLLFSTMYMFFIFGISIN